MPDRPAGIQTARNIRRCRGVARCTGDSRLFIMRSGPNMTTTASLDGTGVFKRSENVVCRAVGREAVLVPIRNNVGNLDFVYTLSPVAAQIWSWIDGSRTVDALIEELCREYEVSPESAAADVHELLKDLAEASLLTRIS